MSKTTGIIIGVLVVLLVAGGIYVATSSPSSNTTTASPTLTATSQASASPTLEATPASTATTSPTATSSASTESAITATTVTYTADGSFSPATLTVAVNTKVTFMNKSNKPMWVASDPHPAHTNYSSFDAKRGIPPGESYSFTFTKAGTWGYHNHLSDNDTGTIIVK